MSARFSCGLLVAVLLVGSAASAQQPADSVRLSDDCTIGHGLIVDTSNIVLYLTVPNTVTDSAERVTSRSDAQALADAFHAPTRLTLTTWPVGVAAPWPDSWAAMSGLGGELELSIDAKGHLVQALLTDSARVPELNAGLIDAARRADSLSILMPLSGSESRAPVHLRLSGGLWLDHGDAALMRVTVPFLRVTTPAQPRHHPELVYPPRAREARVSSSVDLQFVIDEQGRPVPSSLKVVRAEYREFIESSAHMILHSRFKPAMSGQCPVKQLVQQRLTFKMR